MPANEPPLTFPTINDVMESFSPPYWKPNLGTVPERNRALLPRIVRNFAYQWRHILRKSYNIHTFQRLAYALVQIGTTSFQTVVISRRIIWLRHIPQVTHVPEWDTPKTDILSVGDNNNTKIVLAQDIKSAISVIQRDTSEKNSHGMAYYLALSLRHIVLCRVLKDGSLEYTEPEPFLNGIDQPSDAAINLLLLATSPRCQQQTRLHFLPVEIQDMILCQLSSGCIERARVGCMLGIGSPFLWKDGSCDLELKVSRKTKRGLDLPDHEIWFGNHISGVVYK